MVEFVVLLALLAITPAYALLIRYRAQRRPVERRLRELQPIIAPWVNRAATSA